ncbi:hypothetical protein D3C78_1723990 [compost metagenome]
MTDRLVEAELALLDTAQITFDAEDTFVHIERSKILIQREGCSMAPDSGYTFQLG